MMRMCVRVVLLLLVSCAAVYGQSQAWLGGLAEPRDYVQKRVSSYDHSGGNGDYKKIAPGDTLTILDEPGPGIITHIWFTFSSEEMYHLKKLVLRIYWDGETTPSVEAPIGDFFGLGLGEYFTFEALPLSSAPNHGVNSYFPMPFQKRARISIENAGKQKLDALYYNIDYQAYTKPLPADTLYFHAQYRQASPNPGVVGDWKDNDDPIQNGRKNLAGEGNYVWLEATGRGHFVGVTMSVLQNQDYWWGEGDDMFFVDGEKLPSINGTGSEDYFLGAWDFSGKPFAYGLYGAPIVGAELQGGRWSVYRFHLDSPIPFTKSLRATIEHGHANDRGDNFYSVAYWYQSEPHGAFPALPAAEIRVPHVFPVSASQK